MATIPIDQLANEISARLQAFQSVTDEIVREAVDETGKSGRTQLRNDSPKRTGAYAKSWTFGPNVTKRYPHVYTRTLYAKSPHYRLTHLLEDGHRLVRNGRVYGRARAIPHIAPVDERVEVELEERILDGIRKASK